MRSDMEERGGKTALVVIDVQNAIVVDGWDAESVVSRIATVIDAARQGSTPVVYIQHNTPGYEKMEIGSGGWQIHADVAPNAGEPVVAKQHGDAFVETALEETLAGLGVGHLILVGGQSDACIRSTSYGALQAGYDVTLVGDAHTTSDRPNGDELIPAEQIVAHVNFANPYIDYPNTTSRVVSHTKVLSELAPVAARNT